MPSPYAHAIAGIAISTPYLNSKIRAMQHKEDIVTLIVFSLLPDLDALPGLLVGNMSLYHNQFTHSPLFAIIVFLIYSGIRRMIPPSRSLIHTLKLSAGAYGLHLIMDVFTHGRGLMLSWPFSDERYSPPFVLFYGFRHSEPLLSTSHIITFVTESLTMLPVLALVWFMQKRKGKHLNE